MRVRVSLLVLAASITSTAVALGIAQTEERLVLAPDESRSLLDTGLTVTFEAVVEDSRCPVGANCVWAGDGVVRIRIEANHVKPSVYTLHTSERSTREIVHGDVRVGLVSLTPHPTADGPPSARDYRLTLSTRREKSQPGLSDLRGTN